MAKQSHLQRAQDVKNDEFYTLYEDIEKELIHYHDQLKGKIVYCNCDDWEKSNFVRYFDDNFDTIGLRGLMSTCYIKEGQGKFYRRSSTGRKEVGLLEGDGSYDSPECKKYLEMADVVITNPPFSKFRPFFRFLMDNNKDCLVIGSMMSSTYIDIFPYFKSNRAWTGVNIRISEFTTPDNTIKKFGNINWFTTLRHTMRYPHIDTGVLYDPIRNKKYDNYDAVNVDRVSMIPDDCYGNIGVPITYMNKPDPLTFALVEVLSRPIVEGKNLFRRVIIKRIKQNQEF